ncbi:MAG TPA: aminotransferase class IV [Candidatus Paceibacterota bacterium]
MTRYCFLNGRIVPLSKAHLSLQDIGIIRGFGFFEALRSYARVPFHLKEHTARLRAGAKHFNVRVPFPDAHITGVIDTLIKKNIPHGREANIRIMLTGGTTVRGLEFRKSAPTFYILVEPYMPLPEPMYRNGCSLIVEEFERQFPEHKTTNYIEAVSLQEKRKRAGAIEVLYTAGGFVRECATSNIFIVKRGVVSTPGRGILKGITRAVVLEEIRRSGFRVCERDVSVEELYKADEIFITSSFKEVLPVVKLGKRRVGEGVVGSVTKSSMCLYRSATQ